jgi:hypothetical protein
VSFDTAKPETSKIHFTVDTGSATMGAKETDSNCQARTGSTSPSSPGHVRLQRRQGAGRRQVPGGRHADHQGQCPEGVRARGADPVGRHHHAAGTLPLKRLNFKIGDGDWADTSMVADEVTVQFKLALTGVGKL